MHNTTDKYQQALDYIYSFIDYSLTRNLRYSPDKFNLARMAAFMDSLGNPQNDYKVIHVAGTKGKGSTSAMLTSILTSAGYKTGFYSSPHMIDFNERIRIGDIQISNEELVDLVTYVKPYVAKINELTTFEIITAMAFKYFSDKKVDFAVVEVGMGGRLDATNVVSPSVSVITSISHDHTKVLGATLAKIAKEKAGIIKPHVPVVISPQKKSAEEVILKIAEKATAPVVNTRNEYEIKRNDFSLNGQYFRILPKGGQFTAGNSEELYLPLIGDHQLTNARTAYACIQILRQMGYKIEPAAIRDGFRGIQWPGRFEIINKEPLIIIDGAHNRDSFRKLKATINTYLPHNHKVLIFGASEDKEVELMLRIIQPVIDKLVITKARHPRALEGDFIAEKAKKVGMDYIVIDSVEESLAYTLRYYRSNDCILAAGSIFIAGAVKEIWNTEFVRK